MSVKLTEKPVTYSEKYEAVRQHCEKNVMWDRDGKRAKSNRSGGLKRLAYLVPGVIDTQEELATILARMALNNRPGIAKPKEHIDKLAKRAWGKGKIADLAESAKTDRAAWDACQILIAMNISVDVPIMPELKPIVAREITAPPKKRGKDPADNAFRDESIIFMIHMASESDLLPTKNNATEGKLAASEIVHRLLSEYTDIKISVKTIENIWNSRHKLHSVPDIKR